MVHRLRESLPAPQRDFIVPVFERISESHTIAAGAGELEAGTVLAKDAAGKLVPVDSASETASIQTPFGILAAGTIDATESDADALVFVRGYFWESGLTFGGADAAEDHRDALRKIGIYLREG